jgi:hypothetical protein
LKNYEQRVRSTLLLTAICAIVSLTIMVFLLACYINGSSDSSKMFFVWGGAATAIFALIAQNRYSHFKALLVPNTFSTAEFNEVLMKYRKYQSLGSCVFLVLAILGVVLGALGPVTK